MQSVNIQSVNFQALEDIDIKIERVQNFGKRLVQFYIANQNFDALHLDIYLHPYLTKAIMNG